MPRRSKPLKFVDLHCGIGSLRLAFEGIEAECVWSFTGDSQAERCYKDNFGDGAFGSPADIPAHDVLLANLDECRGPVQPCASGRHPFEMILDVTCLRRPLVCLLAGKADGADAQSRSALIDELVRRGYFMHRVNLDARSFGIPQAVTIEFLVAFDRETGFRFPNGRGRASRVNMLFDPKPHGRYYLSESDRDKLVARRGRSLTNGNRWHMGFIADGCANALSDAPDAPYGNIVVEDGHWRVLTEREAARLQGIPDSFALHPDRRTANKQVARCIPVPVAAAVAERVLAEIRPGLDAGKVLLRAKGMRKCSRGREPNGSTSPLCWYGSLNGHASRIVKLFPKHRFFCEVFGGSAAILLSKPPSEIETFNDIDEQLVRFWRVLREPSLRTSLIERIERASHDRAEFHGVLAEMHDPDDPVADAWRFLAASNPSGNDRTVKEPDSANNKDDGGDRNVWATMPAPLMEVGQRLKRVQVESQTFEDILRRYDLRDTFFLLAPPSLPGTRASVVRFSHEWSREDHIRLLRIARRLEAKVALCGYRNALSDDLLSDWHRTDIKGESYTDRRVKDRGLASRVLSVYSNYEPPSI